MTAPEAPAPSGPPRSSSEPLSTLRGAGVNYDARKVGQVVVGLCLVTLAVLVVVFTVAGVHRNSQINELHHDGVPVTVTVTNCIGLMGGSGSNAAGYSCSGSFTVHGTHYTESLPGSGFHAGRLDAPRHRGAERSGPRVPDQHPGLRAHVGQRVRAPARSCSSSSCCWWGSSCSCDGAVGTRRTPPASGATP